MAGPAHVETGLALVSILDLDRARHEVLAALARATDAQVAALWLVERGGAGFVLAAWRGLADRSALAPRLERADAAVAQAVERGAPCDAPGSAPGEALRVPLLAAGEAVAIALLERSAGGRFGPRERAAAAELAPFGAVALHNAVRVGALERRALRDDDGHYHLASFLDWAAKRLDEARRYGRGFALAVLAADGVEALRLAAGAEATGAALRAVVRALGRVVREADVVARASDREWLVLLPETDRVGAQRFGRRAAEELRAEEAVRALDAAGPLRTAFGAATFPADGDDLDALVAAARARQEEARGSIARALALDLAPLGFWEAAGQLLARAPLADASRAARLAPDAGLFEAIAREAAREVAREPSSRALLYLGLPTGLAAAPILGELVPAAGRARAGDAGPRVHVISRAPAGERHPLAAHVAGDARLDDHGFVVLLADRAAYAVLLGPAALFHTCDAPLVDALAARLQAHYELDPF